MNLQKPSPTRTENMTIVPTQPKVEEGGIRAGAPILSTRNVWIRYGDHAAIKNVSMEIQEKRITAIIGPSGCGKSTLLRSFNRMNDFIENLSTEGQVCYRGENVYKKGIDPVEVRRKIGMVFQKPNPFPKTIFKNVSWGLSINGIKDNMADRVEKALIQVALFDEVKDKLNKSGLELSGGQQQRLCIARAIALEPEIVLMDEPCSALDPIATMRIEDLLLELKKKYTIVIVTHNMQQAARVSDKCAFFYNGDLIEFGETEQVFTRPREKQTEQYVTGRIG
ncbi:MAG: phosphate ABC transporter ATP-binding protein PstB [Planctomycetes bacterium]|nr:phosphate ABC transporter ATP-binding protein PstB [Planctomycetota bacterium]